MNNNKLFEMWYNDSNIWPNFNCLLFNISIELLTDTQTDSLFVGWNLYANNKQNNDGILQIYLRFGYFIRIC